MLKFKLIIGAVLVTTLIAFNFFFNFVENNDMVASQSTLETPYGAILLHN